MNFLPAVTCWSLCKKQSLQNNFLNAWGVNLEQAFFSPSPELTELELSWLEVVFSTLALTSLLVPVEADNARARFSAKVSEK